MQVIYKAVTDTIPVDQADLPDNFQPQANAVHIGAVLMEPCKNFCIIQRSRPAGILHLKLPIFQPYSYFPSFYIVPDSVTQEITQQYLEQSPVGDQRQIIIH